jgi:hypothetical protein
VSPAGPCDAPQAPPASQASQAAQAQQSQHCQQGHDACTQGIRIGHRTFSQATAPLWRHGRVSSPFYGCLLGEVARNSSQSLVSTQNQNTTDGNAGLCHPLQALHSDTQGQGFLYCFLVMLWLHMNDHHRVTISMSDLCESMQEAVGHVRKLLVALEFS